jgi:hypothetical protein
MFYVCLVAALPADVTAAVANLQARWGAAAPRITEGALALAAAPLAVPAPLDEPEPTGLPERGGRVVSTGFPALDAILGPGGLPRSAGVAIRGDGSSGRTTLVLRLAAEAQATGSIVAWVDLSRSFDPVEAVARGIRLEWLVVITPETLEEGLAIGGALLAGRSVDLLVLDLPNGSPSAMRTSAVADRLRWRREPGQRRGPGHRPPAGAGQTVVDPAGTRHRRPADGSRGGPEPLRPARSPGDAPDPLRGWRRA